MRSRRASFPTPPTSLTPSIPTSSRFRATRLSAYATVTTCCGEAARACRERLQLAPTEGRPQTGVVSDRMPKYEGLPLQGRRPPPSLEMAWFLRVHFYENRTGVLCQELRFDFNKQIDGIEAHLLWFPWPPSCTRKYLTAYSPSLLGLGRSGQTTTLRSV